MGTVAVLRGLQVSSAVDAPGKPARTACPAPTPQYSTVDIAAALTSAGTLSRSAQTRLSHREKLAGVA